MNLRELILDILEKSEKIDNNERFDFIEEEIKKIKNLREKLEEEFTLIEFIPDFFSHDSSMEKNWAKASDILLAEYFCEIGYSAEAIKARGNNADVLAYTKEKKGEKEKIRNVLVADAKCFRITRTARNQKDFKVTALSEWRKNSMYAVLVAPLTLYPTKKSQIYFQSIKSNVLLISYSQLQFLLKHNNTFELKDLEKELFNIKSIFETPSQNAIDYFNKINKKIIAITGVKEEKYFKFLEQQEFTTLETVSNETKNWLKKLKEKIQRMDIDELRNKFINDVYKIPNKLKDIEKTIKNSQNFILLLEKNFK